MAGIDLTLDIGGLCLFVSQPLTKKMHVVMPTTDMGGQHSTDQHVPILVFDAAYLSSTTIPFDLVNVYIPLRHLAFEVGDGSGADSLICPDVVDLTTTTKGALLTEVLEPKPSVKIASRLTLTAGGMKEVASGVCWAWVDEVRRMANMIRWKQSLGTEMLPLNFMGLDDDADPFSLKLVPRPAAEREPGTINLTVLHSPPSELPLEAIVPVKPSYNAPAPHFEAYYSLFKSGTPVVLPLFRSTDGCTSLGVCPDPGDMGGSPYTCMVAGVTV